MVNGIYTETQGCQGREAAQRTLDGEDRSAIIRGEGKGVQEDETGQS